MALAVLLCARQLAQPVVMSEDLEKRLQAVIMSALAGMPYRAPETPETEERDRTYDAAARCIRAVLLADGWRVAPDAAAFDSLLFAIRHSVMAHKLKPPHARDLAELAQYHAAVAAFVRGQLTRSGWVIEPPATLRKAPPRTPPH